jgi:hypothetical protein
MVEAAYGTGTGPKNDAGIDKASPGPTGENAPLTCPLGPIGTGLQVAFRNVRRSPRIN